MPNDPDLPHFRNLLKELRQALDRSDSKYTHVAVDKQWLGDLIKEGEAVAIDYEEVLPRARELDAINDRYDELDVVASLYAGVDPTFVA